MTDLTNKSYASVLQADEYFQFIVGGQSWLTQSIDAKEAALVQASQLLDSNFDWFGEIATQTQELRWPRTQVRGTDNIDLTGIIPKELRNATMDLANHLLKSGGINLTPNNLDSLKVGPITLDFEKVPSDNDQLIPSSIVKAINVLGFYRGPTLSNSAYNVQVVRS